MWRIRELLLNTRWVSPPREGIPGRHTVTNLRHTVTNLRHTESSLPDRQTEHEPPPYRKRTSAIQNEFFKTLVYVFKKKKKFRIFFQHWWQNSFTKDYNYLIIVRNSSFNATWSVYYLHTKTLLRQNEDIYIFELKYVCCVIIFGLSDTFFLNLFKTVKI